MGWSFSKIAKKTMTSNTRNSDSRAPTSRQGQEVLAPTPLVSIITPTYNAVDYVSATIASVGAQEFQDWEHIIVDDASSDDTVASLREHAARDARIKVIALEHNGGAAVARNAAIDAARGRFIAFLDADDLWLPNKLAVQIDYMLKTGAPFTYASYQVIDEQGKQRGAVIAPPRVTYRNILCNNTIGCLTAVYDTEYFGRVHMPLIRKRQDLGLWLRLLKRAQPAEGLVEILAQYRIRPGSVSRNKASAAKFTWKLYREIEMLPLPVASLYFSVYAINGVIKSLGRWRG